MGVVFSFAYRLRMLLDSSVDESRPFLRVVDGIIAVLKFPAGFGPVHDFCPVVVGNRCTAFLTQLDLDLQDIMVTFQRILGVFPSRREMAPDPREIGYCILFLYRADCSLGSIVQ